MLFGLILALWIILEFVLLLEIFLGALLVWHTPKRNAVFGFKTKKTLLNDEIWKVANISSGKWFIFFGVIEIVVSLITLLMMYQGFVSVIEIFIPIIYMFVNFVTILFTISFVNSKIRNL